jgi:RecA-family ATPase
MSSQESANKFYSIEEVRSLPDPEWLIEDFLPKASFAVLFGPPSVGKSFLALDLALAIAAGRDWFGRTVKGGPVLYIAAEGFGGLKLRISALLIHSEYDVKTECAFLNRPINFLKPDEVQSLIKVIQEARLEPALIIIDTFARCFVGGEENSATHLGLFIENVGTVLRETGAAVLVLHHTGKNEQRGARGSSALIGAADMGMRRPHSARNLATGRDFRRTP